MKKMVFIAALAAFALTGCGGGGSSSGGGGGGSSSGGPAPKPTLNVSLGEYSVSLAELSEVSVPVTADKGDVQYTVSSNADGVSGEVVDGALVVTALDVDREVDARITVKGQSGDATDTATLSVSVGNASADQLISSASLLSMDASHIASFPEESAIADFALDLGFRTGEMSRSDVERIQASFAESSRVAGSTLGSSLSDLSAALDKYLVGQVGDQAVQEAYDDAVASIDAQARVVSTSLNGLLGSVSWLSEVPTDGVIADEFGTFSQFFGNTDMGSYAGGEWSFSGDFAYLNALLGNQCSAGSYAGKRMASTF